MPVALHCACSSLISSWALLALSLALADIAIAKLANDKASHGDDLAQLSRNAELLRRVSMSWDPGQSPLHLQSQHWQVEASRVSTALILTPSFSRYLCDIGQPQISEHR